MPITQLSQALAPGGGQPIALAPPAARLLEPVALDQPFALELVEDRVQGAVPERG